MSSDGTIEIDINVDGRQVKTASKDLDELGKSGHESGKGAQDAKDNLKGLGNETEKTGSKVKKLAATFGLVAIGAAAFNILRKSMDGAIKRFDTLNTFPKVLQALGVSAEESERAINKLSDGIDGLPTGLDEISASAQRMYTSFNDMDKATDSAIALNNSLLGSGSSAEQAQRGTEQYIKALQTGKIQMDTWNTLSETMDVALVKIAESFGYAGKSAKDDLYKALQDGTVTVDKFNDKMIELGTGTGIMAELARENTLGIGTSFKNLQTAASRGIANILESFNKLSKETTGNDIAQNVDRLKVLVNASFKVITRVIEGATPFIIAFADAIRYAMPAIDALSPALIGLASAYALHYIINLTTNAIKANTAVVTIATAAKTVYAIATDRLAMAMAMAQIRINLTGLAVAAYNKIIALAVTTQALLTSGMSLASIGAIALSGAISILGTAIKVLMGPIGLVTLAVGALAGVIVGVIKWFNRSSDAAKKLEGETEELGDSVDSLSASVNESAKAYKEQQTETKATAKANGGLARKIDELANKENKSASEKQTLISYIEKLNDSMDGLNLAYDQEADALNMSSEQLQARVDLMEEEASYTNAMERQLEISKEQHEVVMKLKETNKLREEWNQKLDEGTVGTHEHFKALQELDEQEQLLKDTNIELVDQWEIANEQMTTSMNAITEAVESGVVNQIIAFEDLSESQQQVVEDMKATWDEYYEAATDMFDKLSDEATLTVAEMQENLEENQRVISDWAEGIATLAERGVDEGLLTTLREAGPESAGHVNALVNASDTELEKLSDVFSKGGDVATDALSKSLGIEESGVMNAVGHLVEDTEQALSDRIKSAGFIDLGVEIAKGQAQGIEEGTPEVEDAATEMAKKGEDAVRDQLETHSPSKVFERIGGDSTEGMVLGISNGTTDVIKAAKDLAKSMLDPYKDTPSEFRNIGVNAMSGLNAGLNAGAGQVMSTARRIANNIAYTMRKALEIHSPSRRMEKEVGYEVPAGVAHGIEDNAGSVYKALNNMSDKMIEFASPEMALGAFRNGGIGAAGMTTSNVTNTHNKYNDVDMNGLFQGANFHVRDENDIPKLAKELNDYIKGKARGKGVIMP